jgi:hypothetical protein
MELSVDFVDAFTDTQFKATQQQSLLLMTGLALTLCSLLQPKIIYPRLLF